MAALQAAEVFPHQADTGGALLCPSCRRAQPKPSEGFCGCHPRGEASVWCKQQEGEAGELFHPRDSHKIID